MSGTEYDIRTTGSDAPRDVSWPSSHLHFDSSPSADEEINPD